MLGNDTLSAFLSRISGKWAYDLFGMSTVTITLRWIQTCVLVAGISFPLHLVLVYFLGDSSKSGFYDSTFFAALIAAFWAFYHAFSNEFASKYVHLIELHDSLPDEDFSLCRKIGEFPLYYISVDRLNFCESCVRYNLQDHGDFKFTFRETASYLRYLENHHTQYFSEISFAYETLVNYLKTRKPSKDDCSFDKYRKHREVWRSWAESVERRRNQQLRNLVTEIQEDLINLQESHPETKSKVQRITARVIDIDRVA